MRINEVEYYEVKGVYYKVLYWYGFKAEIILGNITKKHFAISNIHKGISELDNEHLTQENCRLKREIPKEKLQWIEKHYKEFMRLNISDEDMKLLKINE